LYGLAAGVFWGLLTAASATPPEWLVYDVNAGMIYKFLDGEALVATVEAERFFSEINPTLIQIILTFLALVGPAGWATWQLARIRPRGEEQPALRQGSDWHFIGLALGSLLSVGGFRVLGLDIWFKGAVFTPARVVIVILQILLPLYMGISLFLVWFLRLKSVRAPNWDTHYPKRARSSESIFRKLFQRRKGGSLSNK
jgi:hypothetical protein